MQKILFCAMIMITALCLSTRAESTLFNRGVDDVNGNRLIYDDDRDITLNGFSNASSNWQTLVNGASALTVTFNSTPFDDWRLPTTVDGNNSIGPNVTTSEMGHLYYTELGNTDSSGLNNTGDFQNLNSGFTGMVLGMLLIPTSPGSSASATAARTRTLSSSATLR